MFTYEIEGHFDAAHYLPGYDGKCANMHGHRWNYAVTINVARTVPLPESGMFVDFGDVKDVAKQLDHTLLNDLFDMPTAEMIVAWMAFEIAAIGSIPPESCVIVQVWESPTCSVTYFVNKEYRHVEDET